MSRLAAWKGRCREEGLKLTPQRLSVFECLLSHPGHPSAEEVYQEVLRRCPTTAFATVYNTLHRLAEMGEIREIVVDELRRRYDVNTEAHEHAVCRVCHRIVDVDLGERGAALAQVDLSRYGFQVEAATVVFSGVCAECRCEPSKANAGRES